MPVQCTCSYCGAAFARIPSKAGPYCSSPCADLGKRRTALPALIMSNDGTTAMIPLHARDGSIRAYALVNATDAQWAGQWRWCLSDEGYAVRNEWVGGHRMVRMHRDLLGLPRGQYPEVDHQNRNRLDNRRENLRICSRGDNSQNKPSQRGSTSRHRGVYWDSTRQKWHAQVRAGGKTYHLGRFSDESEAAQVASDARKRLMPYAVEQTTLH